MENLFEHDKLIISQRQLDGISFFYEEWKGAFSSELFRHLLLTSIGIYKKFLPESDIKTTKKLLFANARAMDLVRIQDMEWLAREINPLYESLGFTHQVVLMPLSYAGQASAKNYEEFSSKDRLVTRIFDTEEEGMKWFFGS